MRDFEVEVMRRVHNQKLAPKPNLNTNLVTHRGSVRMNRLDLKTLPTPEATDTFKPIPHYSLMTMIEEALAYRHIGVEKEEYAVSSDGMKLFGLMELSFSTNEVRFALGIRTSNDKSMRLSMVAGYRVFICDNMAFSGEFKPLLAKHSKHLELQETLTVAIDRTQRHFDPLTEQIQSWKERHITDEQAKAILYDAFVGSTLKAPLRLLKDADKYFFHDSRFERNTFWALSNAGTSAFKELKPAQQYECTARWGKYLQSV